MSTVCAYVFLIGGDFGESGRVIWYEGRGVGASDLVRRYTDKTSVCTGVNGVKRAARFHPLYRIARGTHFGPGNYLSELENMR